MRMTLIVNGARCEVEGVQADESLLHLLRERLDRTGPKNGCGEGVCGACTVALDGLPVCACLIPAGQADGREVRTVEGLTDAEPAGRLQRAFIESGAIQCGFCTPGLILQADHLLRRIPEPTEKQIREELAGNLCRCTGYEKIVSAVRRAASGPRE